MKLSVSLSERDARYLDRYMSECHIPTRSAAIAEAIKSLRNSRLEADYAAAYDEWLASEDAPLWDETVGDGMSKDKDIS